jgi:superoxide dismutase
MSSKVLTSALNALARAPTLVSAASPASVASSSRALATVTAGSSFALPSMAYDYGALEPFISGEIMKIHHTKHHQAYVTNLNVALEKYGKAEKAGDVAEMIALQGAIKFNGGGHVNHSIFWENLAPAGKGGGGEPTGDLAALIGARFGTFAAFKTQMNAAGATVQVRRGGGRGPAHASHALTWCRLLFSFRRAPGGCGSGTTRPLAASRCRPAPTRTPSRPRGSSRSSASTSGSTPTTSSTSACRGKGGGRGAVVEGRGGGHRRLNKSRLLVCLFHRRRAPLPTPLCRNVRPDYLNAIWSVINWGDVAKRLAKAKSA